MLATINRFRTRIPGVLITLGLLAATLPSTASGARRDTLWQSRDQFVALEQQDGPAGAPTASDHPADVAPDRIVTLLGAVQLLTEGGGPAIPLLTKASLATLAPHLNQGLHRATGGQDVTFAIIGLHDTSLGLVKKPRVTTGRLFVKDGRLNLIVGQAQQDVNELADRRLDPFIPGERQSVAPGGWSLQAAEAPAAGIIRRDWIALPLDWNPAPPPRPLATAEPTPAAATGTPARATTNPAERLTILNELKEKGLITDEEYRDKRREILQGL